MNPIDVLRPVSGESHAFEADRQILQADRAPEGDGPAAKAKTIKYDYSTWGARTQDGISATENDVRGLLELPELALPQSIGVNLFRSDGQATLANSDARARVTYSGGRSGNMQFDCDWRGGFVVHATRVLVDVISYRVQSANPYAQSLKVILAATAGTNAVHPSTDPTLTYLPEVVLTTASRAIEIPVAARRVSLLMRYSVLPGATGDAPLGSTFMSFSDSAGNAMAWIDMLNTRDVVFGPGLAIPAGAKYLGITNNDAASTYLGAIFHLGF